MAMGFPDIPKMLNQGLAFFIMSWSCPSQKFQKRPTDMCHPGQGGSTTDILMEGASLRGGPNPRPPVPIQQKCKSSSTQASLSLD